MLEVKEKIGQKVYVFKLDQEFIDGFCQYLFERFGVMYELTALDLYQLCDGTHPQYQYDKLMDGVKEGYSIYMGEALTDYLVMNVAEAEEI